MSRMDLVWRQSRTRNVRNALLATTALVVGDLSAGAGNAAEPIKLEVRGYFQTMIVFAHTDRDVSAAGVGQSYRAINPKYEGEIWFTGTTKLDNGTSVGVRVELEAWSQNSGVSPTNPTGTGDQIDEEYIFAFGDWGRIELGATDSASFKMVYSAPSALIGWGFGEHNFWQWGDNFLASNQAGRGFLLLGTAAAQSVGFAGDATKITYFSPRFAGLQVGVSFTPSFSASGSTATCAFRGGSGEINNCPRNNNAWHDGLDISANYLNKFGDVSLALYGAYVTAGFDRGAAGAGNSPNPSIFGRYKSWASGAQIGYSGFTLGGGLGRDNNGLKGQNAVRWYAASLMYENGPFAMSAGWWGGRNDDRTRTPTAQNVPGKDKINYYEVGANYTLSPGIKLTSGLFYYAGSGQSKSEKADSWGVVFGTALTF